MGFLLGLYPPVCQWVNLLILAQHNVGVAVAWQYQQKWRVKVRLLAALGLGVVRTLNYPEWPRQDGDII